MKLKTKTLTIIYKDVFFKPKTSSILFAALNRKNDDILKGHPHAEFPNFMC